MKINKIVNGMCLSNNNFAGITPMSNKMKGRDD